MNYKNFSDEIKLIAIGDLSSGYPNGYLLKLSNGEWDKQECDLLLEKFKKFCETLYGEVEFTEDVKDIFNIMMSYLSETTIYLSQNGTDKELEDFVEATENMI